MSEPTVADFRARFSQFVDTSDELVGELLRQALSITAVSYEATLYCLAHLVTLERRRTRASGGSGVIVSETLGPRRVDYLTQAENGREAFFGVTDYGERVLTLEARSPRRAFSVVTA